MTTYIIIETDDGLTIAEQNDSMSAEDVAASRGGVVVDAGPYDNYEEANDALLELQLEDFEERESEGRA